MRLGDLDALKIVIRDNPYLMENLNDDNFECILDLIDNAPTVCGNNPKWCESCVSKGKCASTRPQGKWNYEQVAFYGVCSNCGVAVTSNLADIFLYEEIGKCPYNTNFCPNCGAKMGGK